MSNEKKEAFLAQYGSADHLDKIMQGNFADYAGDIASNPYLKPEHIDSLMPHPDAHYWIAKNENAQSHHLDNLITSSRYSVRSAAARHPNLSIDSIRKSAAVNLELGHITASHKNTPPDVLNRLTFGYGHEVVNHPNVTPEILKSAASHMDWDVRHDVARHPKTPLDTVEQLTIDQDPHVRKEAAEAFRKRRGK